MAVVAQSRLALVGAPFWSWLAPVIGILGVFGGLSGHVPTLAVAILVVAVLAAVHHAEVIALKLGEPYGTLVLAVSVTVIEAGLILSLMLSGGAEAATVARDTIFAAFMIIVNGIVGLCLLIGAIRHFEQDFSKEGVSAALAVLATLAVMTLVLPNFTLSVPGPVYSPAQLAFVAALSLLLYAVFIVVQTVRHRDYFLVEDDEDTDEDGHADPPPMRTAVFSFVLLVLSLAAVIFLAKGLAPLFRTWVSDAGLPLAVVGVAIAGIVLAPESLAAARAAMHDRLQTALNLALGSALATIGLTIPVVAVASLWFDLPLALGLDLKGITFMALSLIVAGLAFATGRTTVLQGTVHLVIFAVYLFTTLVP